MINFDKHLKDLLYKEDFLIIPGMGAFIAKFSQAKLSETGDIIEPVKSFDFNTLIDTDDSNKFMNYILGKENLPKSDIDIQLKNYLFQIKTDLSTNKKVVLADLCSLQRTEAGNLNGQFISELNFYTKPGFQAVKTQELEEVYNAPVPILENPAKELSNDEIYTSDFEEEEGTNWLKYLLYILPLLLVFGALYYVVLYKPFEKKELVKPEKVELSEVISGDTTIILNLEETVDSAQNEAIIEEIHAGLKDQNSDNNKFEVSAGLFKSRENAEILLKKMKDAGFSNTEIKVVNGMRRVLISVNGMEAAEAMSKRIEQFTGDKSVYFDKNGISNK
jgi:hypothetical protein